jgi:hypothetical protein
MIVPAPVDVMVSMVPLAVVLLPPRPVMAVLPATVTAAVVQALDHAASLVLGRGGAPSFASVGGSDCQQQQPRREPTDHFVCAHGMLLSVIAGTQCRGGRLNGS